MERLCLFCKHFTWTAESMWGMGSTLTGPMMEGGWAECAKKHFGEYETLAKPETEDEYRAVIIRGRDCKDYDQIDG